MKAATMSTGIKKKIKVGGGARDRRQWWSGPNDYNYAETNMKGENTTE